MEDEEVVLEVEDEEDYDENMNEPHLETFNDLVGYGRQSLQPHSTDDYQTKQTLYSISTVAD